MVGRIEKLYPETLPLWGKMNASQMLKHCTVGLKIACGEMDVKRSFFGLLFGKFAKKVVVSDKPFRQNTPTAPEFIIKEQPEFEEEKKTLIGYVENFARNGSAGLTKKPHTFFGPMTDSEWDILQWKHLDHHLRQFNIQ